jgi:hypothetical protein
LTAVLSGDAGCGLVWRLKIWVEGMYVRLVVLFLFKRLIAGFVGGFWLAG